jgi:hypothetical protein
MTAAPVSVEPEVTLETWSLVMHADGHVHIAGIREGETRARISSRVVAFDATAMTGTTNSGRTYYLTGSRFDGIGILMATMFWGRDQAAHIGFLSPEELELHLTEPPSPFRH